MSQKALSTLFLLVALCAFGLLAAPRQSRAADHLDAPLAQADGRNDINDLYVFAAGAPLDGAGGNIVFALTVNPGAGVLSPQTFSRDTLYEFLVDTDVPSDGRPDYRFDVRFSPPSGSGAQRYIVNFRELGFNEVVLSTTRIGGFHLTGSVATSGPYSLFAGLREDPFFMDFQAFNDLGTNVNAFCNGTPSAGVATNGDFFAGLNVSALVIEFPATQFGGSLNFHVWARTRVASVPPAAAMGDGQEGGGGLYRLDRMGKPAVNTLFIPPNPFETAPDLEDVFNNVHAYQDKNFIPEFENTLSLLFALNDDPVAANRPNECAQDGNTADDAASVASLTRNFFVPDVLSVDFASAIAYPNGRKLSDDVVDVSLAVVTESCLLTDCVDANDASFSATFPYLAAPAP